MMACGRPRHFTTLCGQTLPDLLRRPPKVDPLRHDRGLTWAHVSAPAEVEGGGGEGGGGGEVSPLPVATSPSCQPSPAPVVGGVGGVVGGSPDVVPATLGLVTIPGLVSPTPMSDSSSQLGSPPDLSECSPSPSSCGDDDEDMSPGSPPLLVHATKPIVIAPVTALTTHKPSIWSLSQPPFEGPHSDRIDNGGLDVMVVKSEPLDTYTTCSGGGEVTPMECEQAQIHSPQVTIKPEPGVCVKAEPQDSYMAPVPPLIGGGRAVRPTSLDGGTAPSLCIDLRHLVPKVEWSPALDSKLSPPPVDCPNPLMTSLGANTIYSIGMALANSPTDQDLPELKVDELEELEVPDSSPGCQASLQQISLLQLEAASAQLQQITRQLRPGSKAYGVIQNGTLTGILGGKCSTLVLDYLLVYCVSRYMYITPYQIH